MSEKTCVMCKSREGTQLSTAGRWFCQRCTDWLPPVDERDTRIERLQKALEQIANMRPNLCTWNEEDYYEKFTECESIAMLALKEGEKNELE